MLHFIVKQTLRMLRTNFQRLQEKTAEELLLSGRELARKMAERHSLVMGLPESKIADSYVLLYFCAQSIFFS